MNAYICIPKIWYRSNNAEFLSVCNEIRCVKHASLFTGDTITHCIVLVLIGICYGGKMAILIIQH